MTGYIVRQGDVGVRANADRTEHYRTTLGRQQAPIDSVVGGWYTLEAGATNPLDEHPVPEIYFVTSGSALITLDGEAHRIGAGDTVLIPAGCSHQTHNDGSEPLVLVFLYSPPLPPRDGPSHYADVS
jgi:mannose-6-phosphate isomerase-like protein (cupin superfamily)